MATPTRTKIESTLVILGTVATLVAVSCIGSAGVGLDGGIPFTENISLLTACAGLALLIQWIAWVPAARAKSETFYDLTGGLTYIGVVSFSLWACHEQRPLTTRQWILSAMVAIWATRLASFLYRRVHRTGKDGRFDELKANPIRFLIPWTVQGLWVFLTALVVLILNTRATPGGPLNAVDALGMSVWLLGFGIEVVADRQKSAFSARAKNKGLWIDEGLWSRCRHPNYFGEILLWTGIAVCGLGTLNGPQLIGLISPIFVAFLLLKISGIPILDKRNLEKWGDQEAYLAYRKRTRVLLPIARASKDSDH
jgi:steroid 5-alpha reductase family enzyme